MGLVLTKKQKDFRKEVSRLNSIANKRIRRLSESEYSSSPAYQKWLESGGEHFSIRGKTQAEVWKEYYRVKSFLDSKTSSITGTKEVLKNINEYTGMNLPIEQVKDVAKDYFNLAGKVSEWVGVKGLGAIYDSKQIYEQINLVTEERNLDLSNINVLEMLDYVTEQINEDYYLGNNEIEDIGFYKNLH